MEHTTSERAVWARVTADDRAAPMADDLGDAAARAVVLYRSLRRMNLGQEGQAILGRMRRQVRALTGLCALRGIRVRPVPAEPRQLRDLLIDLEALEGSLEALSLRSSGETGRILREAAEGMGEAFRGLVGEMR